MLRRTLGGLATAALTATLLVASPPAQAHPVYHPWGTVTAKNQKFHRGCHKYKYTYRITAPTAQWQAGITLTNPHHHAIASATFDAGSDPDSATVAWNLCYFSTVSGKYKMTMEITYNDEFGNVYDGYVHPSTFRITKKGKGR